jgi:hypothetical protein|tara:strand:- start:636 stop:983 length:348 start_codon:yes stop_codon:yes gene_type:complete
MVKIHEEIDLIVKQANRYITYRNKKGSYNEFAHDFLRFANESKIKQNFNFLEDFLKKNINTDPDDMLGMILDFNGLMEAVNNQTKDVDNDKFNQAQQYWNEAQQNLLDRDLYDAN